MDDSIKETPVKENDRNRKMGSNFRPRLGMALLTVCAVLLANAPAALAQEDGWRFGVGTGLMSFSLDGDIGFATSAGGVVVDVDLDNSDTADLFESAFGFAGFAANGPWTINFSYGTVTLEDDDAGFKAEWDKAAAELSVVYNFATTGNHRWGVLVGTRYTDHEWKFTDRATSEKVEPGDDWTDAIVGLTHAVPVSDKWFWTNRVDYGFGDSEGTFNAVTAINWQPWPNWVFNLKGRYYSVEFGDEDDINDSDFYYYDVDEPSIGLGFMYTW